MSQGTNRQASNVIAGRINRKQQRALARAAVHAGPDVFEELDGAALELAEDREVSELVGVGAGCSDDADIDGCAW